jgi:mutual gliding-motility protein MglA
MVSFKGFKLFFHLYARTGLEPNFDKYKDLVKGLDGIVFVVDSKETLLNENPQYLEILKRSLADIGNSTLDNIPLIFQYNKRDYSKALPLEIINKHLNKSHKPYFEAIASEGIGVIETLNLICSSVVDNCRL